MIVHDIRRTGAELLVGVTDEQRWQWELDDGASGADAKTLVCVTLTDHGRRRAVAECAHVWVTREDPLRAAALAAIPELFELAWTIADAGWTEAEARARLFGTPLASRRDPG